MEKFLVSEFFLNYGLFAIKSLTLVILAIIAMAFFASILSARQKDKESIEIEKINDHFDSLQDAIESEVLPKHEYKKIAKEKKKQSKKEQKAQKKKNKKGQPKDTPEETKPRLFILNFDGDLQASDVDNFRKSITALLTVAKEDDEVLVLLESAGGIVHNYGLAASQLTRIKERNIKLTVSVDLVAASGGYMMACIANHIIAAPFAILGSIGVLAQLPNFNRLLTKFDIDVEHHTAGKHKSTLTMFGKNTDDAREKFKEELEDVHILFKDLVAANRPQLDIEKIATGEHWYGTTALHLNLVDEIKTSDDYLLEKSKDADLYQITYQIHETIRDKISTMLYDSFSSVFNKLYTRFSNTFNWQS